MPTDGKVLISGVDSKNKHYFSNELRAMIDYPSFFPDETGFKNLLYLAKIQNRIGEKEINEAWC